MEGINSKYELLFGQRFSKNSKSSTAGVLFSGTGSGAVLKGTSVVNVSKP